jgi:hypothetical protein
MTRQQAFFWWVLASAALMVIGAFGPWVELLGLSAGGTDGDNDGWLVIAVAVAAAAIFLWQRRTPRAGAAAIAGGVLGAIITIYDRSNVSDVAGESGQVVGELVQVGWGLDLAIVASISLAIAGVVWVLTFEQT